MGHEFSIRALLSLSLCLVCVWLPPSPIPEYSRCFSPGTSSRWEYTINFIQRNKDAQVGGFSNDKMIEIWHPHWYWCWWRWRRWVKAAQAHGSPPIILRGTLLCFFAYPPVPLNLKLGLEWRTICLFPRNRGILIVLSRLLYSSLGFRFLDSQWTSAFCIQVSIVLCLLSPAIQNCFEIRSVLNKQRKSNKVQL